MSARRKSPTMASLLLLIALYKAIVWLCCLPMMAIHLVRLLLFLLNLQVESIFIFIACRDRRIAEAIYQEDRSAGDKWHTLLLFISQLLLSKSPRGPERRVVMQQRYMAKSNCISIPLLRCLKWMPLLFSPPALLVASLQHTPREIFLAQPAQ